MKAATPLWKWFSVGPAVDCIKMTMYEIDPLLDPRWAELLARDCRASVFHTPGWLEALKITYGYQPVAYTFSSPRADLYAGWVFCHVQSWLTGSRLVSLPFSDHCDPLIDRPEEFSEMSRILQKRRNGHALKYLECRPLTPIPAISGFEAFEDYCFHTLDVTQSVDALFHALHKDSTQRKIKRAERECLTYDDGTSKRLLDQFYHLLIETRRRHHLPPQPRRWFVNLAASMGKQLKIRVALRAGVPIASILTLQFKEKLVYKYGCADKRFSNVGGMQMLLWRAIKDAKDEGIQEVDLGRSDCSNKGLITFKDRLGAMRRVISYYRYPGSVHRDRSHWQNKYIDRVLSHIPGCFLANAGRLLYRHFG